MGSQRFCLRWNNHQSNLLSVFDQLLHEEAFVDVTLAVEGQYLRAHKMVLSACSPYFQTLFVGHPDKHPIVILKDVPYSDMRSLLDFMYRGEVSVDQDRLTAFLKVAESLKIKGLTEVNEERCDLPSIANSLLGGNTTPAPAVAPSPGLPTQQAVHPPPPPMPTVLPPTSTVPPTPPPPNLHRIHLPPKRLQGSISSMSVPKRKRGRPRKLSSSGPTPSPNSVSQPHELPQNDVKHNSIEHNHLHDGVMKEEQVELEGSPMMNCTKKEEKLSDEEPLHHFQPDHSPAQLTKAEPTPSTSTQEAVQEFHNSSTAVDGECFMSSSIVLPPVSVSICEDVSITPAPCFQEPPDMSPCSEDVVITPIMCENDVTLSPVVFSSGIHFLSEESLADCKEESLDEGDDEADGPGRRDLLEYFINRDGSVVCKWCGELLPSRTHWYRHKYKFHMASPPGTTPLYKCYKCNVYFKSRKGYLGHVSSRHSNYEKKSLTEKDEVKPFKRNRRMSEELQKSPEEYEKQREKEEKLVADIIDRVKKECEAQGSITRKGYSRRSTIMNT